jgi:hypothetical protein
MKPWVCLENSTNINHEVGLGVVQGVRVAASMRVLQDEAPVSSYGAMGHFAMLMHNLEWKCKSSYIQKTCCLGHCFLFMSWAGGVVFSEAASGCWSVAVCPCFLSEETGQEMKEWRYERLDNDTEHGGLQLGFYFGKECLATGISCNIMFNWICCQFIFNDEVQIDL